MDFQKPGLNKRVCGLIIDTAVVTIIKEIFLLIGINTYDVILIVYLIFRDVFGGRSIGKYLLDMQAVDENNKPISTGQAIARNILLIIPFFMLIEYFVMKGDKDGRRIGDKIAKTRVIELKPGLKDIYYMGIGLGIILLEVLMYIFLGSPKQLYRP